MAEPSERDEFDAEIAGATDAYLAARGGEQQRPDLRRVRALLKRLEKAAGKSRLKQLLRRKSHPAAVLLRELVNDKSPTGRLALRLLEFALAELAEPGSPVPVPRPSRTDRVTMAESSRTAPAPRPYCSVSELLRAIPREKPERRALERLREATQRAGARLPRHGPTKHAQRVLALKLALICSRYPALAPLSLSLLTALLDRALPRKRGKALARHSATEKLAQWALESLGAEKNRRKSRSAQA